MSDTSPKGSTDGSLVDGVAALARRAAGVKTVKPTAGGYLAVPEGVRVIPDDAVARPGLLDTPEIGRVETVLSPTAFVEFVSRFGSDQTVVFVDSGTGRAQAILNYVRAARARAPRLDADGKPVKAAKPPAPPAYRFDWRVEYAPTLSPEWNTLKSLGAPSDTHARNAAVLSLQSAFVEGLPRDDDDHAPVFERMGPLDLLELSTGHRQATGADLVGAMSGTRPVAEPLIARFRIPVLKGATATTVLALVSPAPGDGFAVSVVDADRTVAAARRATAALIASSLGRSFGTFDVDLGSSSDTDSSPDPDTPTQSGG